MTKRGSTVTTSLGNQKLIDILQNGKNNLKYSGACAKGTSIFTYSDMPSNKLMPVQFNGETCYVQGTCSCNCPKCYAVKTATGKNGKAISLSWARHTELIVNNPEAVFDGVCRRLDTLSNSIIRLYAAGDFWNQETVDMWSEVVHKYPHLSFFGYTKKSSFLNFSNLYTENCNIVTGWIKGIDGKMRINYGPIDEMVELSRATGAYLCPCELPQNKGRHDICMNTCKECLHRSDIIFVEH